MTETATPAAEPDYDPVLIERLAAAIEGERVADGSWATLELPEARDIVRLVLDALPWPKPDQGSAITVAHADGPTSIEWGTHRTAIIVQPDVLEGWVAQMNEVRRERARAVAEVAEAEAEIERLRGLYAAADEYGDRHVIDMSADGYVIAHPLSCRATGLFACPFNAAAMELDGPTEIGRFAVTLDGIGDLVIGERIVKEESHRPQPDTALCAAPHVSPDCSAGKCGGCSGDAWCDTHDDHAPCACSCHRDTPAATATGGDAS